jgi:hypothetical protein
MTSRFILVATVLGAALATLAGASCASDRSDASSQTHGVRQSRFVVSAMLKRKGTGDTVRLVQSQVAAEHSRDAIRLVVARLRTEYADYGVLDTLATEVDQGTAKCPAPGGLWADDDASADDPKAKGLHHWRPSTRS